MINKTQLGERFGGFHEFTDLLNAFEETVLNLKDETGGVLSLFGEMYFALLLNMIPHIIRAGGTESAKWNEVLEVVARVRTSAPNGRIQSCLNILEQVGFLFAEVES